MWCARLWICDSFIHGSVSFCVRPLLHAGLRTDLNSILTDDDDNGMLCLKTGTPQCYLSLVSLSLSVSRSVHIFFVSFAVQHHHWCCIGACVTIFGPYVPYSFEHERTKRICDAFSRYLSFGRWWFVLLSFFLSLFQCCFLSVLLLPSLLLSLMITAKRAS